MSRPSAEFEFRPPDGVAMVLDHMARLRTVHRGWLNLQPGILEEDAPPQASGISFLFAASVHDVPVCTWVAGHVDRHGEVQPDSLGVQHAAGTRIVARLDELGFALPPGWRWVQDHPRRGLVVVTPPGAPADEQLRWLTGIGAALCTVPITGDWLASVYEGR